MVNLTVSPHSAQDSVPQNFRDFQSQAANQCPGSVWITHEGCHMLLCNCSEHIKCFDACYICTTPGDKYAF
uniref:Uncharacterized protein n=1 Tax=Anguilla anguilla TaxID=7936 RepID=A0A0E9VQR2_ANGAN